MEEIKMYQLQNNQGVLLGTFKGKYEDVKVYVMELYGENYYHNYCIGLKPLNVKVVPKGYGDKLKMLNEVKRELQKQLKNVEEEIKKL